MRNFTMLTGTGTGALLKYSRNEPNPLKVKPYKVDKLRNKRRTVLRLMQERTFKVTNPPSVSCTSLQHSFYRVWGTTTAAPTDLRVSYRNALYGLRYQYVGPRPIRRSTPYVCYAGLR